MPYWNKGDDRKKEDDGWKQRQKKVKGKRGGPHGEGSFFDAFYKNDAKIVQGYPLKTRQSNAL